MKNLEAAQVKMEEKLNSLTNFIDQELQKARESPMSNEYSRRKKRQASNDNPLLAIPAETVKKIIVTMKPLNQAFDELATSYQEYKEKRETLIDGAANNDEETGNEPVTMTRRLA